MYTISEVLEKQRESKAQTTTHKNSDRSVAQYKNDLWKNSKNCSRLSQRAFVCFFLCSFSFFCIESSCFFRYLPCSMVADCCVDKCKFITIDFQVHCWLLDCLFCLKKNCLLSFELVRHVKNQKNMKKVEKLIVFHRNTRKPT